MKSLAGRSLRALSLIALWAGLPPAESEARTSKGLDFRVVAPNAERVELCLFEEARGVAESSRIPMLKDPRTGEWQVQVEASQVRARSHLYYGFRVWGPNWPFDPAWQPGTSVGFRSDVDRQGHRFNPNKVLLDPYAPEMSHDPANATHAAYQSGPENRHVDTARIAPKSIRLLDPARALPRRPRRGPDRALKDDIIYEVHLKSLTAQDPQVPEAYRGTYKGAGMKAKYLRDLGITAVEFLPIHETSNDDLDLPNARYGNYWGYSTLSYFAPDRRYAFDRRPGGPPREFLEMVEAFHREGIKVFLDVVYNHTAEGGIWGARNEYANFTSFRGLDNVTYYHLTSDRQSGLDHTGCGGNTNTRNPHFQRLVLDSLKYFHEELGVDGFRFDLASVLGNKHEHGRFEFDGRAPDTLVARIQAELPRATLIAEPWAIGDGTYQLGKFPSKWAEWNDRFRDGIRKFQNTRATSHSTIGDIAHMLAGSHFIFEGKAPAQSINFVTAHDGFTLIDLYSYNKKNNQVAWPYGPSDGGNDHNHSWDNGGDERLRRKQARTAIALLAVATGTPMVLGGDEYLRSMKGNNNHYNFDNAANWLNWSELRDPRKREFFDFFRRMMQIRHAHPTLRRTHYYTGRPFPGDEIPDLQWLLPNATTPDGAYFNNPKNEFLAFRVAAKRDDRDPAHSIYVAYNGAPGETFVDLPPARPGLGWYRLIDTATWLEASGNFDPPGREQRLTDAYRMEGRNVMIAIER